MNALKFISMLIFFITLTISAEARYITITTTVSTDIKNNALNISLSILNEGDESAYSIQPLIAIFGETKEFDVKDSLQPGHSNNWTFSTQLKDVINGLYPIIIRTRYRDTNSYKFSAISLHHITIGKSYPSAIYSKADDVLLNKEGSINLRIKNTDNIPHNITATLILPHEISSEKSIDTFAMGKNEERLIKFKIRNFSALEGSKYAIYLLLEYDHNNEHYLEILSSFIFISKDKNLKKAFFLDKIFLILIVSMLLLFALYLYNKKKRATK